ncbi:MAG TPA: choice-of-anchor P family protein [Candidatus Angelobacter sp.]|nr:choice-of-anchor P family protein [Candidatus Angelobacter sp.]
MTCSRHHSQYMYSASAYAVAAEFERPKKHSLSPQASVVLAGHGGHGSQRIPGHKVDGLISFKEAYSEVGGSYDDCHDIHTTHAWSVVEGLNIADMLTADRVVSRMAVYCSADDKSEASYDITGSYFENLRIAGHPIEVKLATHVFHEHDTYSKMARAHQNAKTDDWMVGSKLDHLTSEDLKDLESTYHALHGISGVVKECKNKTKRSADRGSYWLSAANHLDLKKQIGSSELQGFGSIICIPKFGVIRLAEMIVHRHSRTLRMFRVQMCSSGHGGSDGGTTSGGSLPPL